MKRTEPSQRLLVSGLIVSVMAHVALWIAAAGFVRMGPESRPVSRPVKLTHRAEKPVVKLGIDDGRFNGLAWLGFKEETPHEAPLATVEQSAMAPAPGTPQSAPHAGATAMRPAPPAPLLTSRQVQEAAQSLASIGGRLSEAMKDVSRAIPTPNPAAEAPNAPQSSGAAASMSGAPGLNSDKESIATSVKNAAQVKLGQVAAADGLDIQTKGPRWSTTTLLTKRPANPTIQITFGSDGKVVRASFVTDGKRTWGTGSAEVDEPLLSAVYSWVARGKRLAELTSQDRNGEVTIMITVIFSG